MVIELSKINDVSLIKIAEKYDINNDGKLDESESNSLFSYIHEKRQKYDSNEDNIGLEFLGMLGGGIVATGVTAGYFKCGKALCKLLDRLLKSPIVAGFTLPLLIPATLLSPILVGAFDILALAEGSTACRDYCHNKANKYDYYGDLLHELDK